MLRTRKTSILVALYLALTVSALFLTKPVASSDDDGDSVDDSIEDENERELRIEVESQRARVKSEFENQTVENEFDFTLSIEQGIRLKLEFSREVNATEFELEVSVRFRQLVEFVDQNGDGLPSPGETVQTVDLTTKTFSTPTVTPQTSEDGESGSRVETHLVGEAFTFQVTALVFPSFAVVNDTIIKPTETKITIVLKDFPFQQNGSVALIAKAESEKEIEQKATGVEKEVKVEAQGVEGFFSWSNQAMVDGVSKEVKSSINPEDDDMQITLSYPNGKQIVHDPKLGVNITTGGQTGILPTTYIYASVGIAAAILITVTVIVLRRRK